MALFKLVISCILLLVVVVSQKMDPKQSPGGPKPTQPANAPTTISFDPKSSPDPKVTSPTGMKPDPKSKPLPVKPAPLPLDVLIEEAKVGFFPVDGGIALLPNEVLTCQEACSLLFGGQPDEYIGSVEPSAVTFTCNGVVKSDNGDLGLAQVSDDYKELDAKFGRITSLVAKSSVSSSAFLPPVNFCYNATVLGLSSARVVVPAGPKAKPTKPTKPTSTPTFAPTTVVVPRSALPSIVPTRAPNMRLLTITVTVVIEFNGTSSTQTVVQMCEIAADSLQTVLLQIISLPIINSSTICPIVSRTFNPAAMYAYRSNIRSGTANKYIADSSLQGDNFHVDMTANMPTTDDTTLQSLQVQLDAAVQSGEATAQLRQYLVDNGQWNDETMSQWKVTSMVAVVGSSNSPSAAAAVSFAPSSMWGSTIAADSSSSSSSPSVTVIAAAAAGAALGVALLLLGGWWVTTSSQRSEMNTSKATSAKKDPEVINFREDKELSMGDIYQKGDPAVSWFLNNNKKKVVDEDSERGESASIEGDKKRGKLGMAGDVVVMF